MSATVRVARATVTAPRRTYEAAAARRSQRLGVAVSTGTRTSTPAFALLVGAVLTVGLLGLLALNTTLAQDAFAAHDLEKRVAALADQEQSLQQEVAVLESPQSLAARAQAIGMVPTRNPVFLRASDGKVLGVPSPGRRPATTVTTTPTAPPATATAVTPPAPPAPGTGR